MAAYNMVNGTHCTENKSILGDILRTQWGWGGFVVSDWVRPRQAMAPPR